MRDERNSNLPPPNVLEALRIPRAEQIETLTDRRAIAVLGIWPRLPGYFCVEPDLLTPAEIEALRRRAKENSAYFRQAFADLRLRGPSR
jgi:hypothetical protein